ncbi:uncharacterized protein BYT42DRAFT_604022 [Radiomyces spectabilis]|uniref:uncharacterized protein n=1 Tax=Radiomyces spectabilis TaxID=64574 RepID=UPI002220928C|nr:uncharacterized protein BYT42DRAFT_604022 [Radiomyces spectabilis]KAI8380959.1 hypothetical protein BYT42DRAFT_604022 [Radiomyces spectabilis]
MSQTNTMIEGGNRAQRRAQMREEKKAMKKIMKKAASMGVPVDQLQKQELKTPSSLPPPDQPTLVSAGYESTTPIEVRDAPSPALSVSASTATTSTDATSDDTENDRDEKEQTESVASQPINTKVPALQATPDQAGSEPRDLSMPSENHTEISASAQDPASIPKETENKETAETAATTVENETTSVAPESMEPVNQDVPPATTEPEQSKPSGTTTQSSDTTDHETGAKVSVMKKEVPKRTKSMSLKSLNLFKRKEKSNEEKEKTSKRWQFWKKTKNEASS